MLGLGALVGLVLGAAVASLGFWRAPRNFEGELAEHEARLRLDQRENRLRRERRLRVLTAPERPPDLTHRARELRRREEILARTTAQLDARGNAFDLAKTKHRENANRLGETRASLLAALERAADVRAVDCQAEWRRETVEAVKRGLDAAASTESERLGAEAKGRARTLLGRVINRYDGVSHLERISNSFTLNERLPDAVAEAFPELTGCTVETQSNPCSVVLRSDDPLSRELGRRVLRQLNNHRTEDGDAFRTLVRETRSSLEGEVRNAGAKAVRALGLTDVGAEIQDLLGRLKFRLSFSQNQWKHSIEVAHLAGILARELDLDQTPARRAGLMHDMGKALTHEREEAHAIVGAEIAARNGESEEVRHAIGAHHYDEAPSSALAFLIIAADAMSGARPGARRDTTSQYAQRVRDIEKIARREPGVARVDVMKGGREVWVTVAGDESSLDEQARSVRASVPLPDEEVQPTARRIACAISDELVFAGQIRVTVIRESRAVSVVRS